MPRTTTNARSHGGYVLDIAIPVEYFTGTDSTPSERTRAARRHWVRQHARSAWRNLKQRGDAYRVQRFVALIGVAPPPGISKPFPARSAETIKPIIDAGTDTKLWEDDDSKHRCSTIYFLLPDTPPIGCWLYRIYIIDVPAARPTYHVEGALALELDHEWHEQATLPDGYGGWIADFTVPHRLWLSSNLTDSDIKARQHGAQKSRSWGRGDAFGMRQDTTRRLDRLARCQWDAQPQWWSLKHPFILLAGVGYPPAVAQADPDNCAESVNTIMQAGVAMRAWPSTSARDCKATVFFRLPERSVPGTHSVRLYALPVPPGFQIAQAVAQSALAGWQQYRDNFR